MPEKKLTELQMLDMQKFKSKFLNDLNSSQNHKQLVYVDVIQPVELAINPVYFSVIGLTAYRNYLGTNYRN
jgi:hypothetical protein